jgi:flavin-binding protein dodecin
MAELFLAGQVIWHNYCNIFLVSKVSRELPQYIMTNSKEVTMASIAKIVELSADSEKSFDDALQQGIKRANETLRNVRSVWIRDQEVIVEGGVIKLYRLHLKVTFKLD